MTGLFVMLLVLGCVSFGVGASLIASDSFVQFILPCCVGGVLLCYGVVGLTHRFDSSMRSWIGNTTKPLTVDQRMNKACQPHGGLIQAVEDQNVVVCVDGKAVKY